MWFVGRSGRALTRGHVALEVEAYGYGLAVLNGLAAPDALLVLAQFAHAREPVRLDARLRLAFGEAVRSCDRRSWVGRRVGTIDGRRIRITIGRRGQPAAGQHRSRSRDHKISSHLCFPLKV